MKQPNSLKEYLKNNNISISSIRSESGLYDPSDYVSKFGNLIDKDDFNSEDEYLEAWEDKFNEIIDDRFNDFKKKYNKLPNPLILYRAVKLKDISKLDRDNLGVYWTDNKNSADTYGEYSKSNASIFILKAEVPKDNIDWDFTIKNNLNLNFGDEEQEINIDANSKIKVLDIYDDNDKSLGISFVGNVGKIGGKTIKENIVESDSFFQKYIQFYYYNPDYNDEETDNVTESKDNITLYHGTDSRHIDKIKEHGIVASQYESPKWYMLSSNKSGSIFHATKDDDIEPYLLTIEIPNDKISEYLWKPREENTFKWYALKKAIPKEFIKKSEVIDSDTWDKTKAKGFDESAITEEPNVPQAAPTPPPGPQGLNQPANPEKANQKRKQMGQKANNWLKTFGRVMPNVSRELQTGNMGANASTFFTMLAQMPKQDWYKYYFRQ